MARTGQPNINLPHPPCFQQRRHTLQIKRQAQFMRENILCSQRHQPQRERAAGRFCRQQPVDHFINCTVASGDQHGGIAVFRRRPRRALGIPCPLRDNHSA